MTTPHTPAALDVAAIEARAAAATRGPWHRCGAGTADRPCECGLIWSTSADVIVASASPEADAAQTRETRSANADFIAHAREDVIALLAALRTLAAQHAADVAAAVDAAARSTREACAAQLRARAECLRRYAYEAAAKADAAEYAHDAREVDACAAIVASVALRTERAAREAAEAQHAADVAAAVAGERERAVAVCRAVADGWERASTTAKVDTGLALIRAEGATECADAIAAPTGGGE